MRTAVEVLGPNPVVDALPLLQRIALSRETRRGLKQHKGLLHDLRTQIIDVTPADPDVEEIKLERLSGRTRHRDRRRRRSRRTSSRRSSPRSTSAASGT